VSGWVDAFHANPWLAVAAFLAAFLALLGGVIAHRRFWSPHPEVTRKALHAGSGLLSLSFPFLFRDLWPVLLLTTGSAAIIAALKFLPAVRRRLGRVVDDVERTTLGELYFPLAVAIVFWLARGQSPLLYCIPMLVLTLADATGALIGLRYGLNRFEGGHKTFEGSLAFAVVAFFCVHVPLLLWSDTGRVETLMIAVTLALLVMLLEGTAWRGLDNLFLPVGGYFLLRAYLPMSSAELLPRLLVANGLVVAVLLSRRATTLVDDSLLAGAFLCYVTWALAGWRWLVPPAILFVGYAWFSPRTVENSRRIHSVDAVLAIWVMAILWLTLARTLRQPALIYPFTLVFACHMAIFGLSRLAYLDTAHSVQRLAVAATVRAWILIFVPFLITQGPTATNWLLTAIAGACIAASVAVFASGEPNMRNTTLTLSRWARQALSGALGSGAGWVALTAISRLGR
jgi:phytol kinase